MHVVNKLVIKSNRDTLALLLITYLILTYTIFFDSAFRYLKYLFPLILILYYNIRPVKLGKEDLRLQPYLYFKKITSLYIYIFVGSLLFQLVFENLEMDFRFFANVFFILSPLISLIYLCFYLNPEKLGFYFNVLFYGLLIGFALEKGLHFISFFSSLDLSNLLLESESATESNIFPFVFLFLFLYAYYHKYPIRYSILSIVVIALGSKRIVFVVLICVVILYYLVRTISEESITRNRWKIGLCLCFFLLTVVMILFKFANGDFDIYIENVFGRTANHLFMGRQYLYFSVTQNFTELDLIKGMGVGSVDIQLSEMARQNEAWSIANLHSEILRNFLEFGIILFSVWAYFMAYFMIRTRFCLLCLTALILCSLTDNILIYFECTFVMYFLILLSFFEEQGRMNKA